MASIAVLSRQIPDKWDKYKTMPPSLLGIKDCSEGSMLVIEEYKGSPAYILWVECSSQGDISIIESEILDPNTPLIKWDECTVEKQISHPEFEW